jgi:hypothetical protein
VHNRHMYLDVFIKWLNLTIIIVFYNETAADTSEFHQKPGQ